MRLKDRLIVALDVSTLEEARKLVEELAPYVGYFKIGLQLAMSVGAPQAIAEVRKLGGRIFFDGKFCDIPNTVGAATKEVSQHGVAMLTVMASSSVASLQAAVENAKPHGTHVVAVTLLTSMTEADSQHIFRRTPEEAVRELAFSALAADVYGLVCSPHELQMLLDIKLFDQLKWITPGIRPHGSDPGDQARYATPTEVIKLGADHLVVGRPITQPASGTPADAAKCILDEIAAAL